MISYSTTVKRSCLLTYEIFGFDKVYNQQVGDFDVVTLVRFQGGSTVIIHPILPNLAKIYLT